MHASIDIFCSAFISVVLPEGFMVSLLKSRRSDLLPKKKRKKTHSPLTFAKKVSSRFVKKLFPSPPKKDRESDGRVASIKALQAKETGGQLLPGDQP